MNTFYRRPLLITKLWTGQKKNIFILRIKYLLYIIIFHTYKILWWDNDRFGIWAGGISVLFRMCINCRAFLHFQQINRTHQFRCLENGYPVSFSARSLVGRHAPPLCFCRIPTIEASLNPDSRLLACGRAFQCAWLRFASLFVANLGNTDVLEVRRFERCVISGFLPEDIKKNALVKYDENWCGF